MRSISVFLFLIAVITLCGPTANADLVLDDFESGALTGWLISGTGPDSTTEPGFWIPGATTSEMRRDLAWGPDWGPTQGRYFASLWSTDSQGRDNSLMFRMFTTTEDNMALSFDYFYDFGDFSDFADPAWIEVRDSSSNLIFGKYINSAAGEMADFANIEWTHVVVPLDTAGDYSLLFQITDPTGSFESYLGVDNVTINVVPLPGALLLGGLGLGFAGGLLGRFRRSRAS